MNILINEKTVKLENKSPFPSLTDGRGGTMHPQTGRSHKIVHKQTEIKKTSNFLAGILFFVLLFSTVSVNAVTLDGIIDSDYYSHGIASRYYGFTEGASAILYVIDDTSIDTDYVWLAWSIDTSFNDASYGTNKQDAHATESWPAGHSFFDLHESDKQRMQIFNSCREMVVDATMDLLDTDAGTPSGWGADMDSTESVQTAIYGDDWGTDKFSYTTSLAYNLNDTGYCTGGNCTAGGTNLLVTSPPWSDELTYTPTSTYSLWEYNLIWEIKIHRDVLATTTCTAGGVDIPSIIEPIELHASPSKDGISPVPLFLAASSIGDTVWLDKDRDGVLDVGEVGIANVTLALYTDPNGDGDESDGAVIFTTTTNADGQYNFPSLADLSYVVKVTDDYNVLSGLTLTEGTDEETKTLGIDEHYMDADFGYAPPDNGFASIGKLVWSDADNDGIQDPGEPGIGGVTLALYEYGSATPVATTTTAADGFYLFGSIDPGTYYVDVTDIGSVLTGYSLTDGPQSSTDPTPPITVEAGDVYLNADFGYYNSSLGTIGNQVWLDLDEDGYFDGGDEKGIANVVIDLIQDLDGDGVWDAGERIIASTYTAFDGTYSFTGLELDDGGGDSDYDYIVNVSDTNYLLSRLYHQQFGTPDTNDNGQVDPYDIALSSSITSNQTGDFGYWLYVPTGDNDKPTGVVGDTVWYDQDRDGVQDEGEAGIGGVAVELREVGSSTLIATLYTDDNGFYYFSQLNANGKQYEITLPDYNFATGGPLEGLAGTNQPDNVDESKQLDDDYTDNAHIDMTLDFGYWFPSGVSNIGDYVWLDADGDGVQDTGERGIPNVTLSLYDDLDGDGNIDLGEPVLDTTVTGSDGQYLFAGLDAGDYIVDVTDTNGVLTGYTNTTSNDSHAVTGLEVDIPYFDADFGYRPSYSFLGDYVWYDADSDGVQDADEQGIPGVTVTLSGNSSGTATTDASGYYMFTGLAKNKNYTVTIDVSNFNAGGALYGLTQTYDRDATLDNTSTAIMPNSQSASDLDFDFGYQGGIRGTIGNQIWNDIDGDGTFDAGEPGIPNVTVDLILDSNENGTYDAGDLVFTTTTTDTDGTYEFGSLPVNDVDAGGNGTADYLVHVSDRNGVLNSYTWVDGPNNGVDNNSQVDYYSVSLSSGSPTDTTADFGYESDQYIIGDWVWEDLDADGWQDIGEVGIAGITLALYQDLNGDGDIDPGEPVLGTTTTDADGYYYFTDLVNGDYVVAVTDNAGILNYYTLTSGLDQYPVTVSDDNFLDADFGYINTESTGSIGDYVWLDADQEGDQDATENGISGVTLNLYLDDGDGVFEFATDTFVKTTTTDTNGNYLFTFLDAGNYFVDVDEDTIPAGLEVTTGTTDPSGIIYLSSGQAYLEADFGYKTSPGTSALGDFVWADYDGDGVQDPGEVGIGGVELTVTGPSYAAGTVVTTAADGSYLIAGLAAGTYTVEVDVSTLPFGFGTVPTNNDNDKSRTQSVPSDSGVYTYDFGFNAPGALGSIGDFVFVDSNSDGDWDTGEPAIQDVTLSLYTDPNNDGDPSEGEQIAATVTDINGEYLFSGLQAGNYVVVVTDLNNVLGDSNPTSDPDETGVCTDCDGWGASSLTAGSMDDTTVDFGYNSAGGTIGNFIWFDQNGDGDADTGEYGIQGITVDLWVDVDENGVITAEVDNYLRTETTDENGLYKFTGLAPDIYLVSVSDEDGILTGYTWTDGADGVDNNSQDDPYQVTLTALNLNNYTADFGYDGPATSYSIGNLVWLDENGSGYKNSGESGLADITLVLYFDTDQDGTIDVGEPIIRRDTTDANGAYLFEELPNGFYIVEVTDDNNVLSAYYHTTGTADTNDYSQDTPYAVQISDGSVLYVDFGYSPEEATAVVIGEFGAYDDGGNVIVRWQTVSEQGTIGFYLYRLNENSGRFHQLNSKMMPGLLHSPTGGWYSYQDSSAKTGTVYTYQLEEVEARGKINTYGPWAVDTNTPLPALDADINLDSFASVDGFSSAARPISLKKLVRLEAKMKSKIKGLAARLELQGNQAKIAISENGFYFISVDEMVRVMGLSMEEAMNLIGSNQIRLRCQDQVVAVLPASDNSGFYFYGEKVGTVYTDDNIYWLDATNGRLMSTSKRKTGKPADANQYFNDSILVEEDYYHLTTILTDLDKDYWFWDYIYPGIKDTKIVTIPTHGIVDDNEATLTVTLQGASNASALLDHHVVIRLNGTVVKESQWGGINENSISVSDDISGLLNDGDNTVEITGIKDSGVPYTIFYVNHVRIDYSRQYTAVDNQVIAENNGFRVITINGFTSSDINVFDISDPLNPIVLSNLLIQADAAAAGHYQVSFKTRKPDERYLAVASDEIPSWMMMADQPSTLSDHSNQADYVVITAGYMKDAAQVLAGYRAAQGHTTMVVDIEDIYDEFSYGIKNVEAIRTFLSHAYRNWLIPPRYVLMAGDGSFDYKDNRGYGDAIVPGMLVETPEGLFITDNYFADVIDEDLVPEFVIGRVPAIDADELAAYIQKVIRYEAFGGDWENNVMLAADKPDEGGNFIAGSNEVANIIPADISLDIIHLDTLPIGTARSRFISGINEGRAFVNFIGHGSPNLIGDDNLFSTGSLPQLDNGDMMPVFTAMTCLAGNFGYPGTDRLNEALVLPATGGAIAMWSPSGYAFNSHSVALSKGFYSARYVNGERVIGNAIFSAQQEFAKQGEYLYYLYLYNLIGDPALVMK